MNPFIQFLIVFDLICFGVYFGGDIVCTALAKVRKKPGQKDPYEFEVEDEPAEPSLSIDAIRQYLFAPPREVVGKCPRCGGEIAEMQKGFFCQDKSCNFAIWKNNNWWAAKRKQPTKAIVAALLKDGRAHVAGLYSEKSGKTYDATVVLEDTGQYVNFKLEFDRQKGGGK